MRARAPSPEGPLDTSCCAALLAVAQPVLPPELVGRLLRWDELSDAERAVARGDLEALAGIMENAKRGTAPGWERSLGI
jgi:hypothetical protein